MEEVNKEEEVNKVLIATFLFMSLPSVIESLIETGQELTNTALCNELNKMQTFYHFDNVALQTFIDNLRSNTQSMAMAKIMGGFIFLNNTINLTHWSKLKLGGVLKGLLGKVSSKIAKGKLKGLIGEDENSRALVVQGAIKNRVDTWSLSTDMTQTMVQGSSLQSLSSAQKKTQYANLKNISPEILDLINALGYVRKRV